MSKTGSSPGVKGRDEDVDGDRRSGVSLSVIRYGSEPIRRI